MENEVVEWDADNMLEVELRDDEAFLQIAETLERIGIANFRDKKLWQSCHILHKRNKFYIVHFKEMFALDGRPSTITVEDIARRNRVATLLSEWGLVKLIGDVPVETGPDRVKVFVLKHGEKHLWNLISKYTIGGHH